MGLDWLLASLHHLAILSLAAILAFELALTAGEVDSGIVGRLSRIDAYYGAAAALALAAGLLRVFLGEKGPTYYAVNSLFWIKMALFAAVALISIAPTYRYIVWSRSTQRNPDFRPAVSAVRAVRMALWIEVALFGLIPIAAAGMARGFGM